MKVLVVDDDPEIARIIATVLKAAGHDVDMANSGSQALAACVRAEYDLLICDLMLPDLPGTEIVRAFKAQAPRLPVIVVSALDPTEWAEECEHAGASQYLQKPLSLKDLRYEVSMVEKGRLHLTIALMDTDSIHRTRLAKSLLALGCRVTALESAVRAHEELEADAEIGLFVIDADAAAASDLIKAAKEKNIPAFAFTARSGSSVDAELKRDGAALVLGKPVNIDALLTQAAFLENF